MKHVWYWKVQKRNERGNVKLYEQSIDLESVSNESIIKKLDTT